MQRLLATLFSLLMAGCALSSLPPSSIEVKADSQSSQTSSKLIAGLVVGVTDGDTITVLDDQRAQHTIRLAGIDAPEKAQAFGLRSKEHLSLLVFGRRVLVETEKQDRYGRTVGKVIINGLDASLAMVVAGMAWHYKKYESDQSITDRTLYSDAELVARRNRQGLWLDISPIEPWDYRSRRASQKSN